MQNYPHVGIAQCIDDYLNGRLDSSQIDALWVHLMQNPDHYELLETQAALKKIDIPYFRKKIGNGHRPHGKNIKISPVIANPT